MGLPSPNGTNKTALYIPEVLAWKSPTMAMDSMPRDVRRQAPALSRQREIAKGEAYGRKIAEQMLAPRHNSAMAFDQVDDDDCILELLDFLEQKLSTKDFERVLALVGDDDGMSASDARDIHPFARAKALGYLAQRLSGDDFKQAHSLLTNNGDLPSKPILPMSSRGRSLIWKPCRLRPAS